MKTAQKLTITILASMLATAGAYAQDTNTDKHTVEIKIPEVAILDIESSVKSNAIALAPTAPNEAGNSLDFGKAINSDLWINYSSIIGSKSDPSRDVTVMVTEGGIPEGLELLLEAGKDAGKGEGRMGDPTGQISLSGSAQKIITGVGSAYTANGPNVGHNLTYRLKAKDGGYASLDFDQNNTVVITYTLSDN
jgi:hypothetical protein